MDPASLVVGALAAGLSKSVTSAVQDGYAALRTALLNRLRRNQGDPEQVELLARPEAAAPPPLPTHLVVRGATGPQPASPS